MSSDYPPYVCPLDAETQKKAEEELFEDPKNRQGAIDTFREWIKQQKHMKCPMDDVFLLGFLRGKHFSQLEAREGLERYMQIREKMPEWMKNLDPMEKEFTSLLKKGMIGMFSHRDPDNRRIAIMRGGLMKKADKDTLKAVGRMFCMFAHFHYLTDEMTQVHGTVTIQDCTGQSLAQEMLVPMEFRKKITAAMQKAFPARLKAFHLYNAGAVIDFFMGIISSLLSEKLRKRVHIHNHGLESLYKHIPMDIMPEEYLPDDFNGSKQESLDKIKAFTLSEMQKPEIRERIKYLSSDKFYIKIQEKDTDVPVASFRKLNVD